MKDNDYWAGEEMQFLLRVLLSILHKHFVLPPGSANYLLHGVIEAHYFCNPFPRVLGVENGAAVRNGLAHCPRTSQLPQTQFICLLTNQPNDGNPPSLIYRNTDKRML
jgi:hypothetical protein